MAATVLASVFHGAAPGTPSDITNTTVRFKRADDDVLDATNPVQVPSSGFNFSFRKNFKIRTTAGPDNAISNLRFFSEQQALGTARTLITEPAAVYVQGSAADESAAFSGTAVDVDTHTASTPLVVNAGQVFGALETGDGTQDFVVMQAQIGATAGPGNSTAAKGLVYRFDES